MARREHQERRHGAVSPGTSNPARVEGVDALRGVAIVAMIVYHFMFDLRMFDLVRADFEHDRFWLAARGAIVTSFLLLVGISLVLARRARASYAELVRRTAIIAACALAVSVASYLVYPRTFITFGVLHCIAVASWLAWPLVDRRTTAAVAGVVVIVAGLAFAHPWFDARATSWIGFTTTKPPTQDYVPLFPWTGVVLLGVALGNVLADRGFAAVSPLAHAPATLRALGRHSLAVYMLHQPLLIGAIWAFVHVR
jgi:uncharacterized membrane protein